MRKFIERALNKLSKLDTEQIHDLICTLASENERIEGVLDSLNDGVVVSDEEHNVILVNKVAERLLPLSSNDTSEKPIWEIIVDSDIAEFVRSTLENQDTVMEEDFTLEQQGSTRVLSCSIMPMVREGHIEGNIFRVEDVTEKRSRDARLRRAENLASLTTLAAGVAHEIKNPLGSIGIHIQLIQKALKDPEQLDTERVQGYIDVVNEEVERLNQIVVDFLFALRPMDVDLQERDINAVVSELLDFVKYELQQQGVELEWELGERLPRLAIDERYLKQAVMNIIKNAMSAMPDGGTLKVATVLKGDHVLLKITDTGTGMSDEVQEKMFEPYYTTKDTGSGIGMTLVYKVVKEHGGDISVNSQEGKGTTVTLSFPVPQKEQHLLSFSGERTQERDHSEA